MKITEVRIKLVEDRQDKLRAYASITLDDSLVIRDLKIIEGGKGLFVAMPSRKIHDRCPRCRSKNHMRARYCNDCGERLGEERGDFDERGRVRLYADIAHPIHQTGRDEVQRLVLDAYRDEIERERRGLRPAPGFVDIDYDAPAPSRPRRASGQEAGRSRDEGRRAQWA